MLSPIGLPPPLPLPRDPELVAATDRAIVVPPSIGAAARWEVGSVLSAVVRFQDDEMLLRLGDHLFSSRPIPGVSEYSRLSMQVARDMSGTLTLVPLLPLAGISVDRVGGEPSPAGRVAALGSDPADGIDPVAETTVPVHAAPLAARVGIGPVRSLSARLHLPKSLIAWLLGPDGATAPPAATAASAAPPTAAGLAGWMRSLAASLSQSGLFFESQLRERRPVSAADLKRRLLEHIEACREGATSENAWSALDELVGLQSAATAANRSGGTVLSFVAPSPEGQGGWWITLQRDPLDGSPDPEGGDGRRYDRPRPWRTRLVGVSLPFGDIDIRIEQIGRRGIGVTVLTDTADQREKWAESEQELLRRLRDADLELIRWSVVEPQQETVERSEPGQLRSLLV